MRLKESLSLKILQLLASIKVRIYFNNEWIETDTDTEKETETETETETEAETEIQIQTDFNHWNNIECLS